MTETERREKLDALFVELDAKVSQPKNLSKEETSRYISEYHASGLAKKILELTPKGACPCKSCEHMRRIKDEKTG